jgi:Zn-dependent protease with chaperone function
MSFVLLTVLLGLVAYGAASALASLPVAAVWLAWGRTSGLTGAPAARLLAALRCFPALAATVLVIGLAVPAFVRHEPIGMRDEIGPGLVVLAGLGALPLLLGLRRGVRGLLATRERVAAWRRGARPLDLPGARVPAFQVHDDFPVVGVVGLRQPTLYVADQVLAALSGEELAAVCAHEQAHVASQDNLKALLLRSCPDWIGLLPLGREMEDAWLEAAEQAADDVGAGADRSRALDLAAALLKAARLVPDGARLDVLPAAALQGGTVADRVERLVADPRPAAAPGLAWALLGSSLASLAMAVLVPGLQDDVHRVLELLVRFTS